MDIYPGPSEEIVDSLRRYADERIETGGFLRACLENNLKEACARADLRNQRQLIEIVRYMYNHIPSASWGSPKKVAVWLGEEVDE